MRRALELNEIPLLSCCAEEHHPSQTFRSFATERPFKSAHLSPPIRLHPILAIFSPASGSRSEEHTSELQSLMRISYAVFCLKKKTTQITKRSTTTQFIKQR